MTGWMGSEGLATAWVLVDGAEAVRFDRAVGFAPSRIRADSREAVR